MRKNSLFLTFLLTLTLTGCGYTTRSMIASQYKTIYVAPFVNKVDITSEQNVGSKYQLYRPLLETDITKVVSNKYFFDGNLKPVKEETADVILKGELMQFRKDPLRYSDSDNVSEYRVNIVVNLTLWDRKENKTIWVEDGFTGDTTYFTSGSQAVTEDQAINAALTDLARRIVERTVEQW